MNTNTHEYDTVGQALDAAAERRRQRRQRSLQDVHNATEARLDGRARRQWANVRFAHKPFEPLKPEEFQAKYYQRTHRTGKTERDHANGAKQRNFARKQARADWQKNANKNNPEAFPI